MNVKKAIALVYGLLAWVGFLAVFTYAIAFLGDFWVPKTVNTGPLLPPWQAILIDIVLVAIFGIHHSVAARPWFKKMVSGHCPPHLERSTYVMISNVLFAFVLWQWKPVPEVMWSFESEAVRVILYSLFGLGWVMIVLSSFLIDHFDLFGVRQVFLHFQGKEYHHVPFTVRFLYRFMRNPLMLGWFIVFWSVPTMTVGHFVFAAANTIYGFIGIYFEERTLLQFLGKDYEEYRKKTPLLFPIPKMKKCPFSCFSKSDKAE